MKNLNIAAKIWLSIGVFVVGYVFSTVLVQVQGRITESGLRQASGGLFPAAQKTQDAESAFQRAVKNFQDAVVLQDVSAVSHGTEEGKTVLASLKAVAAINGLATERLSEVRSISADFEAYLSEAQNVYGAIARDPSSMTAMQARIRELAERTDVLKASLHGATESCSRDLKEELGAIEATSSHQRWLALTLFFATLVLAAVIVSWTIRRSITGPILRVIDGVQGSADQAATASARMAHSGQMVARDAEEQAACLLETSTSLQEISSTTRQNADRAVHADSLMSNAKDTMKRAMDAMASVIASMNDISSANREVATVLKSLDEIAFHTNILALNAAVEAARAGEAGAGFSVVADEVRSLARRAKDSAGRSADIIEKTIGVVTRGVGFVDIAHGAFTEASGQIALGSQEVGQIAESSEKQALGIKAIGQAISRMEQVTQNNAAIAQQTAENADAMTLQVETTRKHLMELFTVVGHTA